MLAILINYKAGANIIAIFLLVYSRLNYFNRHQTFSIGFKSGGLEGQHI